MKDLETGGGKVKHRCGCSLVRVSELTGIYLRVFISSGKNEAFTMVFLVVVHGSIYLGTENNLGRYICQLILSFLFLFNIFILQIIHSPMEKQMKILRSKKSPKS